MHWPKAARNVARTATQPRDLYTGTSSTDMAGKNTARSEVGAEIRRLTDLLDDTNNKLINLRRLLAEHKEEDTALLEERYGRILTATSQLLTESLDDTRQLRRPGFQPVPEEKSQ